MATAPVSKSFLLDRSKFPADRSRVAFSPATYGDMLDAEVVEEDSGDLSTNDGWVRIDCKNLEFINVRGKGQMIITSSKGLTSGVRNDKARYGVILCCGGYKGREARQDLLTPECEKMFPLPYGTLVEHICMAPYEAGESQGLIRTEHITAWVLPGKRWPSWVRPSGKPDWLKALSQEHKQ